jgi:tetratricopeptide (TPR) repeat protein
MLGRLIRGLLGVRNGTSGAGPDAPASAGAGLVARARALLAAGGVEEAERACLAALATDPSRPEAHVALGEVRLVQRQHAAAAAAFRSALQRDAGLGDAHLGLARALYAAGDMDGAILAIQQAERLLPERAEVWSEYGLVQLALGNLEWAAGKFRRAATLRPDQASPWINLAIVENRLGNVGQSVEYLRKATELEPGSGLAWSNLGLALRDLELLDEAERALRRARELRPRHPQTCVNLATILFDQGRIGEAEALYREALALDPGLGDARVGLAEAQIRAGAYDAARSTYEQVLAEAPDNALARTGLGQLQVALREFAPGWANYESRFGTDRVSRRAFPYPRWDGRPLAAGRLLIHTEQGIGDMILFASCFADALRTAPEAVIEAPEKLAGLFARSFPDAAVRCTAGAAFPEWLAEFPDIGATIPAGSLMALYRSDARDFPGGRGYLKADPARVESWRERLAQLGGGLTVGVSWRGGFFRTGRQARSVPLEEWLPILATPGCRFVSLQYTSDAAADVARAEARLGVPIAHWPEAMADYEETAALVAALDVVITVCTAVAHLSGALGQRVWILAPAVPSWRYLAHGETLPWYPSARMFRQALGAPWRDTIAAAAEALAGIAPAGAPVAVRPVSPEGERRATAPAVPGPAASTGEDRAAPTGDRQLGAVRELVGRGDLRGAAAALERLAGERPDSADIQYELATVYRALGDIVAAHDCLEVARAHDPRPVPALLLRGRLAETAGDLERAGDALERACELAPDAGDALTSLARVRHLQGRSGEARALAARAIACDPGLADAHQVAGLAAIAEEDYEIGAAALERAIPLAPAVVGVHLNLANAYLHLGRFDACRERLEWVLAREPGNFIARWDYAHLQLAARDFAAGWPNYEYRLQALQGALLTGHRAPWQGEPLEGKTLLVLGEQGIGDQIMFASCLPEVTARARECILVCEPRLVGLFTRSFPEVIVRSPQSLTREALERADFEVQAGSLPVRFRRSAAAFPDHRGYLRADPARVAHWRERLGATGARLRIGLSWRGGTAQTRSRLRSIPLAELAPLLELPDARFVSLQYGDVAAEVTGFRRATGIDVLAFPEAIADYDETAALVSALDLVVTVCTSVVHLTGALGRPVWVLVPSVPEWRYCLAGDTLPWYPSARLFRQRPGEGWAGAIAAVGVALAAWSRAGPPPVVAAGN